jgi:hypothetical protein
MLLLGGVWGHLIDRRTRMSALPSFQVLVTIRKIIHGLDTIRRKFYCRVKATHLRGECRLLRESHLPGFWMTSYGQTSVEERITHKVREERGEVKNSMNGSGFSWSSLLPFFVLIEGFQMCCGIRCMMGTVSFSKLMMWRYHYNKAKGSQQLSRVLCWSQGFWGGLVSAV